MDIDNYEIFQEFLFECEHEMKFIDESYEEVFAGYFECEICGHQDFERDIHDSCLWDDCFYDER